MNYIGAFIAGGLLCMITQIIADLTKKQVVWVLTATFCIGVLLSATGIMGKMSALGSAGVYLMLYGGGDAAYQGMFSLINGDVVPLLKYVLLILYCAIIGIMAALLSIRKKK